MVLVSLSCTAIILPLRRPAVPSLAMLLMRGSLIFVRLDSNLEYRGPRGGGRCGRGVRATICRIMAVWFYVHGACKAVDDGSIATWVFSGAPSKSRGPVFDSSTENCHWALETSCPLWCSLTQGLHVVPISHIEGGIAKKILECFIVFSGGSAVTPSLLSKRDHWSQTAFLLFGFGLRWACP